MPITNISNNEAGSSVRSKLNAVIQKVNEHLEPQLYRALLTQSAAGAPSAVVLENTLGGTVVWARTGTGAYTATLVGAFPVNKTFLLLGNVIGASYAVAFRSSDDVIAVETYTAGVADDDVLISSSFEILVYP